MRTREHHVLFGLAAIVWTAAGASSAAGADLGLADYPYRIVCETFRDGNWELYTMNADGSDAVNITRTPQTNELYPHASPDGTKVCFVVDQGEGDAKVRSVWYMNLDGTGRTKVADNAREPCWSPDGTAIAYLGAESKKFTYMDYATKGAFIYDLATGGIRQHPNHGLFHLYNTCWSPDGNWFAATVHGGMGYDHAILAFQANGPNVFNLGIPGCRPDISPDGRRIVWGASDWLLAVADLDLTSATPKATNRRDVVVSKEPMKVYHADWSPDGRFIAFSRGPTRKSLGIAEEIVGVNAKDWNLCVADANGGNNWQAITTDGASYKEPDWIPAKKGGGQ